MMRYLIAGLTLTLCPASAAQQLVAHFSLDEVGGLAFGDTSGNGQDGDWINLPTLGAPGVVGAAADLDPAALQRGDVVMPAAVDPLLSDLTVTIWVNPRTLGGVRRFFANDGSWAFGAIDDRLRFTTRNVLDYDFPVSLPTNQWTHVAAVFDASFDVTFYIDGLAVGTVTGAGPANLPLPDWHIGALQVDFELWDGLLDDIQVYDGSASAAQILDLFANPGTTLSDLGQRYCMANPNSTGDAASIRAIGSQLVSDNDVTLVTTNVPRFAFSFFITSQTQGFVMNPAGSAGNLCLGGAIGRYVGPGQILQSGVSRTLVFDLDLTMTPTPQFGLVAVQPGETWNFQTWFRDAAGGMVTSNFSNAVSVGF